MDVFFVISGFLISSIILSSLEKGTFSFKEFYARRIKRIFPALIMVMSTCFVFGWFELLPDEFKQLGKHIAAGAGFVANIIFWQEAGYFDNAALTKPLLHLWSLGIEEQFYTVWPLLIYFAWSRRFNILILAATIVVISFSVNVGIRHIYPVQAFYSPQTRFWELMIGSILAYLTLHNISLWDNVKLMFLTSSGKVVIPFEPNVALKRNTLSILGMILIGFAVMLVNKDMAFPGLWALLPTLGTYFIISAGQHAWLNRTLLSHRIMVWFGLISYPLYLWHWPLLSFARYMEAMTIGVRLIAIALAISLAWITYRLIEHPMRFGKQNRTKIVTLTLLMAVLAGVGYAIFLKDGLPSRYPDEIRKLAKITNPYAFFEVEKAWRNGLCHSVPKGITLEKEINNCAEKGKATVFIWGDSYAASLYPGLKRVQKDRENSFGIAQFTTGNGPPFFDKQGMADNGETVLENSNRTLSAVAQIKPSIVLITWMVDEKNGIYDMQAAVRSIEKTVEKIRGSSPKTDVIILGSFPRWNDMLFNVMINYFRTFKAYPPEYMSYGLNEQMKKWDSVFGDELSKRGIRYISVQKAICNNIGCLTRVGDSPTDLTAVDWGHLTPAGSYYLMKKIETKIFSSSVK